MAPPLIAAGVSTVVVAAMGVALVKTKALTRLQHALRPKTQRPYRPPRDYPTEFHRNPTHLQQARAIDLDDVQSHHVFRTRSEFAPVQIGASV